MMRLMLIGFAVVCVAASSLYGDEATPTAPTGKVDLKLSQGGLFGSGKGLDLGGLLDTKRLSFQNTVGMSFQSGSFGGMSQYYMNTMTYHASKPLVVRAQVGIENTMYGSSRFGSASGNGARVIVPYLGLQYQPRENLLIDISFSNMQTYYRYRRGYPY